MEQMTSIAQITKWCRKLIGDGIGISHIDFNFSDEQMEEFMLTDNLYLYVNEHSKTDTIEDLQPISLLKNIETLELSGVRINKNFTSISHLPKLKHLHLEFIELDNPNDLQVLSGLQALTTLLLYENLEYIPSLERLTNLKFVSIEQNVKNISFLKNVKLDILELYEVTLSESVMQNLLTYTKDITKISLVRPNMTTEEVHYMVNQMKQTEIILKYKYLLD